VVGVVLIAEGFDQHVPKGYVYFAMAFSISVEMLNITMRKRSARAVKLHAAYEGPEAGTNVAASAAVPHAPERPRTPPAGGRPSRR
jgi:hypothetical protein